MAQPADAERSSGYVVGGISPIGQKRALPTVVDETALALDRVYVSGGRRGLDISLAPADLVTATAATVAPIAPLRPRPRRRLLPGRGEHHGGAGGDVGRGPHPGEQHLEVARACAPGP